MESAKILIQKTMENKKQEEKQEQKMLNNYISFPAYWHIVVLQDNQGSNTDSH